MITNFTKYERISICAILFFVLFPFTCFTERFLLECLSEQLTSGLILTFFMNLFGGGFLLLCLFGSVIVVALLLGIPLFYILYCKIVNKIFQDPYKKRKTLIGFILIYLIMNQIVCYALGSI